MLPQLRPAPSLAHGFLLNKAVNGGLVDDLRCAQVQDFHGHLGIGREAVRTAGLPKAPLTKLGSECVWAPYGKANLESRPYYE